MSRSITLLMKNNQIADYKLSKNKKRGKSMKLAKKITTVLVALCMVFSFSMLAVAADGKLTEADFAQAELFGKHVANVVKRVTA